MAPPKFARIVATEPIGRGARLLEALAMEPLGFVGGQYVIVDSGLVAPTGKAVKRAYSLLTSDNHQQRFSLAVERIPQGPGSGFMHALAAGAELRFSGPWGKLYPPDGATGRTLVLATDTGVTAALGLLSSLRFRPLLAATTFVWLRPVPDEFLPDAFVRARTPAACADIRIEGLPAAADARRVPHVRGLVAELLARGRLAQAFISGDGVVNYALLDDLVAAGVPATRDHVESFFNMPKKST